MDKNDRIFIAGGNGQLGRAIIRNLINDGYENILSPGSKELNLCDSRKVEAFFEKERPQYVFFCAAYIGGIEFKKEHPADIFSLNMKMLINVFENAHKYNIKRLLYTATALVYPSDANIPTSEKEIKSIAPDGPDSPYTLIKYSGMKLCEYFNQQYKSNFFTVIPCNFFGPYAPFEGSKAGVVPSLIRRMHEAKKEIKESVIVWGTGNVGRDFLGVDDVASACIYAMLHYHNNKPLNIGSGKEISIREAAQMIKKVVGYEGRLEFDASKPEGRKHMLLDVTEIANIGWTRKYNFEDSVGIAYNWYRSSLN